MVDLIVAHDTIAQIDQARANGKDQDQGDQDMAKGYLFYQGVDWVV
jgi:hypothetical protein